MATEKRKRKPRVVGLTWDQLDPKDHLTSTQRAAVDFCIALIESTAGHRGVARLFMLDYIAGMMLYETFRPVDQVEEAASTHANNIMGMADDFDELCRG